MTLPLIGPGILAGAVMGFAKAMGEFGATITFVANIPGQTQTLPSAIYAFLQVPGGEGAALRLVALASARGDGRGAGLGMAGAAHGGEDRRHEPRRRYRHRFGGFALEADFEAGPGVTALFGPSGSGKRPSAMPLPGC